MANSAKVQERALDHTGSEVGEDAVELQQNDPGRKTRIAAWTCPRKFESIRYHGRRHYTKLELRYQQRTYGEEDFDDQTLELEGNLNPVAGEEDIEDQPIPVLKAANIDTGEEIDPRDMEVDYHRNAVSFNPEVLDTETENVVVFPLIQEGAVQFRGVNQFGQVEGPADKWMVPMYRWSDFDLDKQGSEVNLQGSIQFTRDETMELVLESDLDVVWESDDYEHTIGGSSVSTIEQRVDIER